MIEARREDPDAALPLAAWARPAVREMKMRVPVGTWRAGLEQGVGLPLKARDAGN